jgi:prepilin-type processing-associated H-X9-DG protein
LLEVADAFDYDPTTPNPNSYLMQHSWLAVRGVDYCHGGGKGTGRGVGNIAFLDGHVDDLTLNEEKAGYPSDTAGIWKKLWYFYP